MAKETLLIVEDNMVLRDGLGEMLSFEGFTVLTAANGREALHRMNTVTPDLILSDITMPEMDGFTFLNFVRARSDWVTIPFIFLTAKGDKNDVLAGKNLGAEDYLVKPVSRQDLVNTVRARLSRSQQIRVAQLQQAYEASLVALANAIDLRDSYTFSHVEHVMDYSMVLARHLGWQEWRLEQLRFGAILHDIGKIFISERILRKPTPLTTDEWEEMMRHPVSGSEMVKKIGYLSEAVPVIRHHHERWDGKGYPDNLTGENIPMGARIVFVADSFDAMTTNRPYRSARSLAEAYQELYKNSGTQYDPTVVSAFQKAWDAFEIQAIVANRKPKAK